MLLGSHLVGAFLATLQDVLVSRVPQTSRASNRDVPSPTRSTKCWIGVDTFCASVEISTNTMLGSLRTELLAQQQAYTQWPRRVHYSIGSGIAIALNSLG
jgi:hypothetical protein